jgi:protein phosphatase
VADLRWGAATDAGRIRPDNEDNLLAEPNVFAVADGMGGHRAGEVASALAVDLLRTRLSSPGADLEQVVATIAEVNSDIYRAAIGNPDQQGMGTTVTALAVIASTDETETTEDNGGNGDGDHAEHGPAEQLALVNVGDSRTYLLRHGRLRRVTVDHSYVQELVATGHITDDEARTHPRRNIVTRALGIDPSVRVDAWTLPLVRGDRFLLCSDGLVDEVRDNDIVGVLQTVTEPQAAADELVALANRQGGRDNITVIVVDVLDGAEPPDAEAELDLEPAWEDTGDAGTWAVDAAPGEATEFDDLAALVTGEEAPTEATTAATAVVTPAPEATESPKRRKRRLLAFFGAIGVLAVLIMALVVASAYARRGYFVAFDSSGHVAVYRGRTDGFLWFDPTVRDTSVLSKDQLDQRSIVRVQAKPRFDTRAAAQSFIGEQLVTTTTSTTTTTTTTTIPTTTTTVAPTTAPAG